MNIEINKTGKLLVDGVEKDISEIDSSFLENIVDLGLKKEVIYKFEKDDTNPLVALFKSIENLTKPDSEFVKELDKISKDRDNVKKKLENLSETISGDSDNVERV